jgi:tetratricopeptide (TPR) repeat protein
MFIMFCASLITLKLAVMDADYRGDIARLTSLRTELAALHDDPAQGYLADYWSGYASHRIAMNGTNSGMPLPETRTHLEQAVADYESSLAKKPDFADAYTAAALAHGWLANAAFFPDDAAAQKAHFDAAVKLQKKAEELEPSNPRVLWTKAAFYFYSPPERGGSVDKAMELYRQQIANSKPAAPESPLPEWGKAEALMSLAFAHMMKKDFDAATAAARDALKVQPQWHYVKDILIPQIAKARE